MKISPHPTIFPLQRPIVVSLLLVLVAALAYANSFPGTFIQDDLLIVKNNPLVQSADLRDIFTSDYWRGMENSGLYRPLTILSLAFNRLLTGPEPWGFHLVNVLLQAGVAVLVWVVLRSWGAPSGAAFFGSLVFAVHPIHAEVVNEAVGRSELLVAVFALLALRAARSDSLLTYPLVWSCFILALLSKEHAIVVLVLIPLADLWLDGLAVLRRRFPLYLGMLVLTVSWLLLRAYGVEQTLPRTPYSVSAVPLAYLPWDERTLTALQYQWIYVGKILFPFELHAVYSLADLPPIIPTVWSPRGMLVVGITLVAILAIARGWIHRHWWALAAAAYIVSVAPTSNIFVPIGVTMAERLVYFPSVWSSAIIGWAFHRLMARGEGWRAVALATVVAYLVLLGVLALVRNRDFASEIALWQREVLVNETDFLGWHSYAQSLSNGRRYDEAELAYREMLRLEPDFQGGLRSYFTFLYQRGRFQEAIQMAEKALSLSRAQNDETGITYDLVNLASAYLELNNFGRAVDCLRVADVRSFQQPDIFYVLLGRALQGIGDHAGAVAAFARVASYEMDVNVPLLYGISFFNLGRMEEAVAKLNEAIAINERPEAWNLLGTIAAQKQSYAEAIEAFSRAVQLAPQQEHYQENLARARDLDAAD